MKGASGTPGQAPRELPPQVTMGLLNYLTTYTLDEDYAVAARRRRGMDGGVRSGTARSRRRWATAAALAAFAVVLVVAGVQTTRDAGTASAQRNDLIGQVQQARSELDADHEQVASLTSDNSDLRRDLNGGEAVSRSDTRTLRTLRVSTGTVAVHGPGVQVVVDNAPHSDNERTHVLDVDLQRLVNGLWRAGAEAISINGQRLTATSAIRHAGDAITVNFRSLERPYTVQAIGDPDTLPSRFADSASGQTWIALHQQLGLRFEMVRRQSLRLPAVALPTLRYATSPQSGSADRPGRQEPQERTTP